eukprot:3685568-Karenia_brevis.AAC.1
MPTQCRGGGAGNLKIYLNCYVFIKFGVQRPETFGKPIQGGRCREAGGAKNEPMQGSGGAKNPNMYLKA